jgi:hypothetical protein
VTSTIGVVKAALVGKLAAALPNVQVIYGSSAGVTTRQDRVIVVGKTRGRRAPDSLGELSYSEDYTVEIVVSTSIGTSGMKPAEEVALADYADADAAIRSFTNFDLGLGGYGVQHALPEGDFECFEQADGDGRHAAVRFTIHVLAQPTS